MQEQRAGWKSGEKKIEKRVTSRHLILLLKLL